MIKGRGLATAFALGLLTAVPAEAQLGVVGGIEIPVSSSVSDEFKTGWTVGAFYEYLFMNPTFGVRLDGSYGELKTKDGLGFTGKDRFISGIVSFMVHLLASNPDAKLDVYAGGGVGVANAKFTVDATTSTPSSSENETKLGFQGTLGGAVPLGEGRVSLLAEARWKTGFFSDAFGGTKSLLDAVLGFRIGLGGN